jgi:hypothetical protein
MNIHAIIHWSPAVEPVAVAGREGEHRALLARPVEPLRHERGLGRGVPQGEAIARAVGAVEVREHDVVEHQALDGHRGAVGIDEVDVHADDVAVAGRPGDAVDDLLTDLIAVDLDGSVAARIAGARALGTGGLARPVVRPGGGDAGAAVDGVVGGGHDGGSEQHEACRQQRGEDGVPHNRRSVQKLQVHCNKISA